MLYTNTCDNIVLHSSCHKWSFFVHAFLINCFLLLYTQHMCYMFLVIDVICRHKPVQRIFLQTFQITIVLLSKSGFTGDGYQNSSCPVSPSIHMPILGHHSERPLWTWLILVVKVLTRTVCIKQNYFDLINPFSALHQQFILHTVCIRTEGGSG